MEILNGRETTIFLYDNQSKYAEAEPLYQRSLAIREKALGPEHPDVAQSLESYAALLRQTARADEAARMEARTKAIRAKSECVIPFGSWRRGRGFCFWLGTEVPGSRIYVCSTPNRRHFEQGWEGLKLTQGCHR